MAVGRIPQTSSSAIEAVVDAKGDILVGSANDTVTRLPVGTTGQILTADSSQTTGLAWSSGIPTLPNNQTVTSYTAVLSDAYKLITMSNSSANTFQIPTNANVPYAIGTTLNVIQISPGQTTITAANSGVTAINSSGTNFGSPKLRVRWSSASCIKVDTDSWYIVGDIV